jgi:hypothetical protein
MTKADFWELIRSTRRGDPEEHVERLVNKLAKLPEKEILAFGRWWEAAHRRAYSWKLWGAAYLMNGGCSDDGFTDFRSWLLLQGQAVYEAALKNPDTLARARVGDDEAQCECYPAPEAYQRATGADGHDPYYALNARYGDPKPPPDLGDGWDFDDDAAMRKRYPKLAAKFLAAD